MPGQLLRFPLKHAALKLELEFWHDETVIPKTAVILTHPYGPLGGDMHNNVVERLWRSLKQLKAFLLIRFNSRGVGDSGGRTSWTGTPELNDCRDIITIVLNSEPPFSHLRIDSLILCGYSYGGVSLLPLASEFKDQVKASIAISYPYSVLWMLTFFHSNQFLEKAFRQNQSQHILLIQGCQDQFTSKASFDRLFQNIDTSGLKRCVHLENVDHFWFDREQLLVDQILEFLRQCHQLTE